MTVGSIVRLSRLVFGMVYRKPLGSEHVGLVADALSERGTAQLLIREYGSLAGGGLRTHRPHVRATLSDVDVLYSDWRRVESDLQRSVRCVRMRLQGKEKWTGTPGKAVKRLEKPAR